MRLRGERQRGDRRRAQLVEIGGDRIGQPQRLRRVAEQRRLGLRHEAEGDALGQALRGQRAAGQLGADLLRRQRRRAAPATRAAATPAAPHRGRAGAAPPRPGRTPARSSAQPSAALAAIAGSSVSRLIQHDRCGDVVAPGRHRDGDARGVAAAAPRSRGVRSDATASSGGMSEPPRPAMRSKRSVAVRCQAGWRAGLGDRARLAAAQFQDHRGGGLHRVGHQRGIDAALEALARVGDDLVAAAGERDADRIEQRALDEHRGRGFVAAGRLAADHAGHRLHAGGVGDGAVLGGRPCSRGRSARGTSRRAPGRSVSTSPVSFATSNTCSGRPRSMVKKLVMSTSALIGRRPIEISRSCSHCGLGAVAQVADGAAEDPGAGLGPVDLPARAAVGTPARSSPAATVSACRCRPAARSRATPRTAEAIAAVRRDADVDDRIVEPGPLRVGHADRRILGQIDDAGVILAETHLALGQQHAGAVHAADFADLQRDAGAGDERAGRRRTRPSCRCAHSARRTPRHGVVAGIDRAHAQPVGVRVLHRLDHVRDAERGERGAAVLHALQFQADAGQRVGDLRRAWRRYRDASSARRG